MPPFLGFYYTEYYSLEDAICSAQSPRHYARRDDRILPGPRARLAARRRGRRYMMPAPLEAIAPSRSIPHRDVVEAAMAHTASFGRRQRQHRVTYATLKMRFASMRAFQHDIALPCTTGTLIGRRVAGDRRELLYLLLPTPRRTPIA